MIMLLMFVVIYFVMIRPQQKRMKAHQSMLSELGKGDAVITRGGIVGKVTGVQDKFVVLEIQEKVRIRVLKSAIESRHDESAVTGDAKTTATPKRREQASAQA